MELVDCGESFEAVRCPHCGTPLEIESWQDAMDRASTAKGSGT